MAANPPDPAQDLIACPTCDLLHAAVTVPVGGRQRCRRCHTVLMTNRTGALDRTLAAAFASVVLMISAIFFPFLELSAIGLHRRASVLDAAMAFSSGLVLPLSVAVALLIIIVPMVRALALAYTLLPLRLGRPPAAGAERAFRLAAHLKPWSMAEVFIIGVVVALVKVGGMASIDLGPAFWAMAALVLLVIYEGTSLCEWTVWRTLERARAR
jgi:paraquat-inducible protein A